jgi:hypothetical protein
MSFWTLKYNGKEKPLADWGIKNLHRTLVSQDIDTVTFEQPHATALAAPLFPEDAIIEIFRGDEEDGEEKVRWFYGRVEDAGRFRSGSAGGLKYKISGPWWWLANMGFRQSWKVRNQQGQLVDQYSSYCLLGSKADGAGTQQSIADQIAEAVNYAIGQGAPLAFDGTGLPTIFPPIRDVWNAPVSEVIQKMIEWTPDIVCWFDYTTDPFPTLRMRRREDQEDVEISLSDTRPPSPTNSFVPMVRDWDIVARNDLKVPGVVIYYIRTDTTEGSVYTVINEEKYPPAVTGRETKALLAAINLEGANITYAEGIIECVPLNVYAKEWWKRHDAHLQSDKITDLSIKAGSAKYTDDGGETIQPLANELFGLWSPWMGGAVREVNVSVLASWKEKAENNEELITIVDRPIVTSIFTTGLETGTYRSAPGGSAAEAQPEGLAEALYKAASRLHYDGRITIKESQCTGAVSVGNVLNLLGGLADWEEMDAQVQSVTESIDNGETSVIFGPPKHLGPTDYIELLRATRNRIRFASPSSRETGIAGGNSAVIGKTVSKQVATSGHGGVTQQTWVDPTAPLVPTSEAGTTWKSGTIATPGKIVYDLRDLHGLEMRKREWAVCIGDREMYALIDSSEPYAVAKTKNPIGASSSAPGLPV